MSAEDVSTVMSQAGCRITGHVCYEGSCWIVIDSACIVCGAGSMKLPGASVRLSHRSHAAAAGLLLSSSAGRRYQLTAAAQLGVVQEHGTHAGSVTLTADVGS